jgi:hypothetical protein
MNQTVDKILEILTAYPVFDFDSIVVDGKRLRASRNCIIESGGAELRVWSRINGKSSKEYPK